ncbi:MAG TPA: hypothetical protein VMS14_02995, partial [Ilumatobacteraceae bacterium]|nr:hypothetical protein [Ilumatobacteraceae bacterium]
MADPSSEVIAAARAALGTLVELVPTAEREADDELTVPLDWFHWLDQGLSLFHAGYYDDPGTSWEPPDWADKFLASSG